MSKANDLSRILIKGGILSPALLFDILTVAEDAGNKYVFLGSRQDILFYQQASSRDNLTANSKLSIHKKGSGIQNVVSSFVCVDILPSMSWVYSGIYLKVLEQFTHTHKLRINIVDPKQNLVPLFYGHLNFVASETPNYWHLCLNLEQDKNPQTWPGLIFTDDIADFAQCLENIIINQKMTSVEMLKEEMTNSSLQKHTLESEEIISLPKGFFPYYEGLNKIDGKDQYWTGFYWRNNQYPIRFLKEVCDLCKKTNVGKISFTPWKTILIKDIELKDKIHWEELIGRYGINMRHSSLELNWHLPLLDKQALKLKQYLVSKFDKFDIRTFGLSFAIQNKPGERFTTIVIRSKSRIPFLGKLDPTRSYSIEYADNYNPNNSQYKVYAKNLSKRDLPNKLKEISKKYYALLFVQNNSRKLSKRDQPKFTLLKVFQCPYCLTAYDERYGDKLANIAAGIPFIQLKDSYACQICERPKSDFIEMKIRELK